MKKHTIVLMILMLVFCLGFGITAAYADTTENGLEYTESEEGITITGYTGTDPKVTVPAKIDGTLVIAIGEEAFKGCTDITSIELPAGLKKIGTSAFEGCGELKKIELPEGIESIGSDAFYDCADLEEAYLPEGIKEIGEQAFSKCISLKKVELPKGLQSVGKSVFSYCWSLAEVILPEDTKTVWEDTFDNCSALETIKIPASVEKIDYRAFSQCFLLKNIDIPEGCKYLGKEAFSECHELETIKLPDSIIEIGDSCFYGCEELSSFDMPLQLRKIGTEAFGRCSHLNTLYFSPHIEEVGDDAFLECRRLSDVYIRDIEYFNDITQFGKGESSPVKSGVKVHTPQNIEDLTFNSLDFIYDGTEHTVIPKCKALSSHAIAYDELKITEPGTYELVVKAANPKECYGEKTLKIRVDKRHLEESDVSISGIEDITYTGKALKQNLTVKLDDQELVQGTDYRIYYDDNIDAGEAKVSICFKGNYSGSIDDLTFNILPAKAECTLSAKTFTYTGKAVKPAISVRNAAGESVAASNYTVTYSKNKSVGTAGVKVTFKGNYEGTKTLNFTIKPAKANVSKLTAGKKKLTVKMSSKPSVKGGSKYQVAYKVKGTSKWKYTTSTSQSKVIKNLKKGKKYYVKVRAYKSSYKGAWSKTVLSSKIK